MIDPKVNPEIDQDRVDDLFESWKKYGYLMFPQQKAIYEQLAERMNGRTVIEAGCGVGLGTNILAPKCLAIIGTDKLQSNIDFANELYPHIDFVQWDINYEWKKNGTAVVVCVECIEHVRDPIVAIRNLLNIARDEVWISTPNGINQPRPPSNPFHVQEYTISEMKDMIHAAGCTGCGIDVLRWNDFSPVPDDTDISPLVYKVNLV